MDKASVSCRKLMIYSILSAFLTLVFTVQASSMTLKTLDELEWENRILIIQAKSDVEDILSILRKETAEIDDRHMLWFLLDRDAVLTNYPGTLSDDFSASLRSRFRDEDFKVILIGKDGGIKSRQNQLDLLSIFTRIDGMPMRQLEMNR